MATSFIILDDLRRHVHRCAREAITHGWERAEGMVVVMTNIAGCAAGPLKCTMVFGEDFCSAEVDEFDDAEMIEENIYKSISDAYMWLNCRDLLSGLMSRWTTPFECRYAKPSNIWRVYT
jgi:hypothetical protein